MKLGGSWECYTLLGLKFPFSEAPVHS